MITPTTVSRSFIKWMEDNGYGSFGTNIYLNQIPDESLDNAFWIVTAGGDVNTLLVTRESIQQFTIQVNCRNRSNEELEDIMFNLSQRLNDRTILTIDTFDLHSIEATMPEDEDRDAENRRVSSFTVNIEIYVD